MTVTSPEEDTVATSVEEDDQVIAAPTISFPSVVDDACRELDGQDRRRWIVAIEGETFHPGRDGWLGAAGKPRQGEEAEYDGSASHDESWEFPAEMAGFSGFPAILAGLASDDLPKWQVSSRPAIPVPGGVEALTGIRPNDYCSGSQFPTYTPAT